MSKNVKQNHLFYCSSLLAFDITIRSFWAFPFGSGYSLYSEATAQPPYVVPLLSLTLGLSKKTSMFLKHYYYLCIHDNRQGNQTRPQAYS